MKVIHFSDTHLGYSDYGKFDSVSGVNQRELDTYNAFKEIVDYIIKTKPDLVLHAGDLFDNIRPSNRAISEALEQFFRLSKANIPTVVIAGNHEAPRQKSTETIFKILKYFPNIYPVFNGQYEKLEIGKCAIHVIPHTYSDEDLQESVKKLKPDKKFEYNIVVAHTAIRGVQEASWGEYKEQTIPSDVLTSEFNYIALGHYHRFVKVKDNAYYCGSPERFSFNEVKDKKGFLEVELDDFSVTPIPINARNMIVFDPIDCSDLSASEIVQKLQSLLDGNVTGNIVKVIFDNIPRHVHSSLDFQKIREIVGDAIHYEPVYNWKLESGVTSTTSQIGTLNEEFETYLNKLNLPKEELVEIKTLGLEYLGRVIEEVSID
ncbi:MAG: exonuclease SbcCD subunit D [Nitrosarchaeum sp.]|nr:exonuclease SbcCD subunit D [Nitrosarchaeum sp.]